MLAVDDLSFFLGATDFTGVHAVCPGEAQCWGGLGIPCLVPGAGLRLTSTASWSHRGSSDETTTELPNHVTLHLLRDLQTEPPCLLLGVKEEEGGFDFYKSTRGTELRTKRSLREEDSWSSPINPQENLRTSGLPLWKPQNPLCRLSWLSNCLPPKESLPNLYFMPGGQCGKFRNCKAPNCLERRAPVVFSPVLKQTVLATCLRNGQTVFNYILGNWSCVH